ncbi:hypothetical protein GCM10012275_02800 [Longimycelium tulufanense]|uniref:Uncharacterized protein n=1 Tax=Longimycelium tulufanense TaxID=907463 RepID=A0A8J3C9L8_9PSEU|nr:hypothetical protein GCM10012275_02800 [Longimycelium tulufanense]
MEQTSTWIWPVLFVLRVVKVLPQPQVTWVTTYSGWIPLFTCLVPISFGGRRVPRAVRGGGEPVPDSTVQSARRADLG